MLQQRRIAFAVGFLATSAWCQNPVPFVQQPLIPPTALPGGPGFTLTVNGSGFVAGSIVNWNGHARTTTFVSGSELSHCSDSGSGLWRPG